MRRPGARPLPAEWGLLAALVAWGVVPVIVMALHALHAHERFTGVDGLIGADGVLGADQLQYLGWARDAGTHGLISDLFTLPATEHVFVAPVSIVSGAMWRFGLSLQLAYLLWKPLAALALFAATFAWAGRLAHGAGARAAVVALSLFLYTPLTWLVNGAKLGSGSFRFQLYLLGWELLPANKLWGYMPSALALALMPVALLAIERALDPRRGHSARPALALAAAAALFASLLHPWQGVTLVLVFAGLAAWRAMHGWRTLAIPAVAAALPLLYYEALARGDPAWKLASANEVVARLPLVVLLAGLGPPALIAAAGLRRPGEVVIERALLLWIVASVITYFTVDAFASHALQGLSLPFAVLAVRGWRRLRLSATLGLLAVAVVSMPGLAWDAQKLLESARSTTPQYYLTASDARALDWIAGHAPAGGVLAPTPFAIVVPSQTGRAVWFGHPYWSNDYFARAGAAGALFAGRMRPPRARAFVFATGARLLISDCAHRADLARMLGRMFLAVHRFGCATVYVVTASSGVRPVPHTR